MLVEICFFNALLFNQVPFQWVVLVVALDLKSYMPCIKTPLFTSIGYTISILVPNKGTSGLMSNTTQGNKSHDDAFSLMKFVISEDILNS